MATDIQSKQTQEATPAQNTARPPINPMEFDESALAKLLKRDFSGEEEKAAEDVEPVDDGSASAETDDDGQADDPTAEQTENQDESPGDVLSDDGNEDEATDSNGVRKRIDKLTRQKKEALERVEALERELEEAKANKPAAAASAVVQDDSQFGNVWDVGKLSDEWTKARQLKRWCEDNEDGCEVDGKEYSAEDVKQIRRRVEDAIDVHIPERARFLQSYQSIQPVVQQLYPWWKDQKSVEYTAAQDVLRQMPQLRRMPEHQVLIGDFLEGRRRRLEREAAKGTKQPARVPVKAPSQPGKPMAAPLRKDPAKTQLQAAKSKFKSTGTQSELAQLLKRML